ncbi:MAG: hypothetical protein A2Z34_04050 [Planctomycetes bacterium RBG_16_59_8]|nr:MAG: hypothetical protein A2Z34_04050 [Planctomycetes bacterium RBG_16_59_8]
MAIIDTLKVYESLKVEMPDRSAKAVAKALELSFEEYRVNQGEFLATKQDLAAFQMATKQDMADLRVAIKQDMADLRVELKGDISGLRTEIAGVRSELIKWMFIFWVGQIGVLTGILVALR